MQSPVRHPCSPIFALGEGGYGYAHAYGESSTMELVLAVSTLFLPIIFIKFYPFQVNSMVNLLARAFAVRLTWEGDIAVVASTVQAILPFGEDQTRA